VRTTKKKGNRTKYRWAVEGEVFDGDNLVSLYSKRCAHGECTGKVYSSWVRPLTPEYDRLTNDSSVNCAIHKKNGVKGLIPMATIRAMEDVEFEPGLVARFREDYARVARGEKPVWWDVKNCK
jgi:hypothetical protein